MADISTFQKKKKKNQNKYSNIIQSNSLGYMTHMYLLMKWSTGLNRENGLCFMKGKDLPLSHNSQWHIQIFMKTNDHHDSRVMQTM